MTEQEAKNALFKIHLEYMSHSPKERVKLYDEYQKARREIKDELAAYVNAHKNNEVKKVYEL